MNIRLNCLFAAAAVALTACGPTEDPAANVAVNDLNALVPSAETNAVTNEMPETNTSAEPAAEAPEQPAAKAPEPTMAASAKPAPTPEPEAAAPANADPTCAPEHRAAGHC